MEINDIIQLIQDTGIYFIIMAMILFLGLKYLPKYIDLRLQRSKEKDYMMDSLKAVVENSSKVIENNTKVIESNSTIIKNYTDNAHKLEHKMDDLIGVVNKTNVEIEILKEIEKK